MRAPWRAYASAVVTNPNDGTTTVSPGPMSSSKRAHLERGGARRREQHVACTDLAPEERVHLRREGTVGRGVAVLDRRPDELDLVALDAGPVERDAPGRARIVRVHRASFGCVQCHAATSVSSSSHRW